MVERQSERKRRQCSWQNTRKLSFLLKSWSCKLGLWQILIVLNNYKYYNVFSSWATVAFKEVHWQTSIEIFIFRGSFQGCKVTVEQLYSSILFLYCWFLNINIQFKYTNKIAWTFLMTWYINGFPKIEIRQRFQDLQTWATNRRESQQSLVRDATQ